MTIPLPDPLFWDPVSSRGDYAVVEQSAGIFLLQPASGRIIARLHPLHGAGAQPLGPDPLPQKDAEGEPFVSPPGWPFRPGDEIPSTPVVGDLEDDGIPETIFATRTGWIWALGQDGLPPAGWPVALGTECPGGVALADLNGDGQSEVLVGDAAGVVHALRRDGTSVPGWPARIPGSPELKAIYGSIACADMDGDGRVEIVACQAAGRVCVFHADGSPAPGWPVAIAPADAPPNAGTIFARAALGDVDGDGRLEVIAAANNYRVHAWDVEGRPLRGWPRLLDNLGRAGYAEPVLADLDGDGRPEVIVPTDHGFNGPARIYVLDRDGKDAPGWPVDLPERCNAGVAVGDLDGDGRPEVVAATVGEDAWVLVWNTRGRPRRGFPLRLREMSVNASPVLADADGDGAVDILLAALRARFEPAAVVLGIDRGGRYIPPFPIHLDGCEVVSGGPCVADLDGNGKLELLLGTEVQGRLYAWELAGSATEAAAPWPRSGFDAANSGLYRPPGLRSRAHPEASAAPAAPAAPPQEGPYPFPALTSVSFLMLSEGRAHLTVTNVQGAVMRVLLDTILPTGSYTISWDGTDGKGRVYPPGVYFYELEIPGRKARGQLLLLR